MSNASQDHGEDHSVYVKVGVVLLAVLAGLVFLAFIN